MPHQFPFGPSPLFQEYQEHAQHRAILLHVKHLLARLVSDSQRLHQGLCELQTHPAVLDPEVQAQIAQLAATVQAVSDCLKPWQAEVTADWELLEASQKGV